MGGGGRVVVLGRRSGPRDCDELRHGHDEKAEHEGRAVPDPLRDELGAEKHHHGLHTERPGDDATDDVGLGGRGTNGKRRDMGEPCVD